MKVVCTLFLLTFIGALNFLFVDLSGNYAEVKAMLGLARRHA